MLVEEKKKKECASVQMSVQRSTCILGYVRYITTVRLQSRLALRAVYVYNQRRHSRRTVPMPT